MAGRSRFTGTWSGMTSGMHKLPPGGSHIAFMDFKLDGIQRPAPRGCGRGHRRRQADGLPEYETRTQTSDVRQGRPLRRSCHGRGRTTSAGPSLHRSIRVRTGPCTPLSGAWTRLRGRLAAKATGLPPPGQLMLPLQRLAELWLVASSPTNSAWSGCSVKAEWALSISQYTAI